MSDSCDPVDCGLQGSSVHGVLQERIPEWVAISFSRGSSTHLDPGIELRSPALQADDLPTELGGNRLSPEHHSEKRLLFRLKNVFLLQQSLCTPELVCLQFFPSHGWRVSWSGAAQLLFRDYYKCVLSLPLGATAWLIQVVSPLIPHLLVICNWKEVLRGFSLCACRIWGEEIRNWGP